MIFFQQFSGLVLIFQKDLIMAVIILACHAFFQFIFAFAHLDIPPGTAFDFRIMDIIPLIVLVGYPQKTKEYMPFVH